MVTGENAKLFTKPLEAVMKTTMNTIIERALAAVFMALVGALFWIVLVLIVRWPLLFAFVFFGIAWAPAFFGWGILAFMGIGAVIGTFLD